MTKLRSSDIEGQVEWSLYQSLMSANIVEWFGLTYSSSWVYTRLRNEYAPYTESQLRWRKHIFILEGKVPLPIKGIGAYTAFCLILKGIRNKQK